MEDEGPTPLDQLVAYKKVDIIKDMETEVSRHGRQIYRHALNEEGKITLWLDVAHDFSALSLVQLPQPIIVVFTSLRVKLFADNIILNSIGSTLRSRHSKIEYVQITNLILLKHCLLLPSKPMRKRSCKLGKSVNQAIQHEWSTNLSEASKSNFHSIITLTLYKVFLVLKDETDEITALIIGITGEKVFGMPCKDLIFNQRSADQKQLPSEFLRLIRQKKKIQLRYGSRRNSLNSNDFLIYNISGDLTIQPVTPQSLSREITVSSTTVSPSTTLVDTTGESDKRKRESVRRALFIPSEEKKKLGDEV
ncbi:hypothetical protein DVH24_028184 [Malus domestica]|uniref:Uncharacterized protein n=1 Tax=Malus domestica TaxID=3750 RepID=A0A498HFC5_MALDO|nr:hypothetical protein DVH24_028184 [Malus domestica]